MTIRRLSYLGVILLILGAASFLVWKREEPEEGAPSPLAKIKPEAIARIEFAAPGVAVMTLVQASSGTWTMPSLSTVPVAPGALDPTLSMLRDFSTGSLVSDSPGRFDQYAVSTASGTRLTVYAAQVEKPVLDLLVGKPTANGQSSFVRRPEENLVYVGEDLSSYRLSAAFERLRKPAPR